LAINSKNYFHFEKLGAFLIPFIISSIIVGIPYALLEVSLGQWMKEGGIGAWG
jgi:SNF family Na+-dependent transporter